MKTNQGIVKTILLIVGGILLLSFFGIDLQEVTAKPIFRKNVEFIWTSAKDTWKNYIYKPIFNKNATSTGESGDSSAP